MERDPSQPSLKVPGKLAPFQVPQWGPYGKMPVTRAAFYLTFRVPSKEAPPLQIPFTVHPWREMPRFQSSLSTLSQFSVSGLPKILTRAPMEKGAHLQSLPKSLVDEPPAYSPAVPSMESDVCPLSPPPHILPSPQKMSPAR